MFTFVVVRPVMNYFEFIAKFLDNEEEAFNYLKELGILPTMVICPDCDKECKLRCDPRNGRRMWYCGRVAVVIKKGKKRCYFSMAERKNTYFEDAKVPLWSILLFINEWFSKSFQHYTITENLKWGWTTSVKWRNFCSEVLRYWYHKHPKIGGEGVVVEFGDTSLTRRTINQGDRSTFTAKLFGAIERESKRVYIFSFESKIGNESEIMEYVEKYIDSGSVIISRCWPDVGDRTENEIKYSLVDSSDMNFHTDNVDACLMDLKEWMKKPGVLEHCMDSYIARYLFLRENSDNLHDCFLAAMARKYSERC